MRSLGLSLALGVTPLLLGVAPSEAVAQRARAMMAPTRPMMTPSLPGMGMSQLRTFNSSSLGTGSSAASQMTGSSAAYQMPYGASNMYAMPSGGSNPYQMSTGGYGSSSPSSSAQSQAKQSPKARAADQVEVSGPLDTPPPHRAIIRVRLPRTWVSVWFDGRGVDSMGKARTYVTPELSGAKTFEVTALWQNNGRTILLQDEVTVKAGEVRTLDFTKGN